MAKLTRKQVQALESVLYHAKRARACRPLESVFNLRRHPAAPCAEKEG